MTFRFPEEKERKIDVGNILGRISLDPVSEDEGLTGLVLGKKASDLEERTARALRRNRNRFDFRVFVPTIHSFPGQSKELDFLVFDGILRQPLGVKGPVSHSTQAQLADDIGRESLLNITFALLGWLPFKDVKWPDLQTQESADRKIRELF